MKISIKNSGKLCRERFYRCCALLFLFIVFSTQSIIAQAQTPNVKNIKDNLTAIKEAQKKQAHEEFMGYIYMVLGFSLVIFVAWFSTVKAKKYKESQDEKKRKFLEAKIASQAKSGHGHSHSHRDPHRKGHRK